MPLQGSSVVASVQLSVIVAYSIIAISMMLLAVVILFVFSTKLSRLRIGCLLSVFHYPYGVSFNEAVLKR